MNITEITQHIRPLSDTDKLQLIQVIMGMLKDAADDALLQRLEQAAEQQVGSHSSGPLEAYEAASQLQNLPQQEAT